ncbi:hypothetical protein CCR80_03005 [Rhodothalassium salexigens]|uniref:hydrolase n=1 Tax=Rhodothalassium salexigens TaxID=1086 RepID=UPI0019137BB0|nr:hydrolase [Rhodothalassium salexigens]MBK5920008.1 hypothetical protein [Rhodothalassium salexigens]
MTSLSVTPAMQDALAWLDDQSATMVAMVERWAHQPSGSWYDDGLAAMGAIVRDAFADLGGTYDAVEAAPGQTVTDAGEAVAIRYGPIHRFTQRAHAPRRVLLTGHLDTVYPEHSPFTRCRWLDDTTLNGPGVADMKGGLIVMLHALKAFERTPLAQGVGWQVLVSSDEEIGSIGSGPALDAGAARAHIGLTYEPALADGTLAGARKGSGNFTLVVDGRSAHAGREFEAGRNAVWQLARAIDALYALNGQRPGVTVNPAVIHGGSANNVVPARALCRFNIRVRDADEQAWAETELAHLVDRLNGEDGFRATLHGGFYRPPKVLSPANRALFDLVGRCGETLGVPIAVRDTGGCCEGNNLAAAGLPNVDTLGVRGSQIHSHDEFVLVDSFAERAKLSFLILCAFAQGEMDAALAATPDTAPAATKPEARR